MRIGYLMNILKRNIQADSCGKSPMENLARFSRICARGRKASQGARKVMITRIKKFEDFNHSNL